MNDLSNKDFAAGLVPGVVSSPASTHILKTFFISNQTYFPNGKICPIVPDCYQIELVCNF